MKNNLYHSLLGRLKNKHAKLSNRFHKSVKDGEFQKQRYRKRKDAIERLKSLEKRIGRLSHESGLKVSLNYKHWAFALAMGAVISTSGQEVKKKFIKRENHPIVQATSSNQPLAQTLFFDPPSKLGNAYPNNFVVGDLDGDGDLDGIYISYVDNPIVLINQGGFVFAQSEIPVNTVGLIENTVLADFDGDGDLDLFAQDGVYGSPTPKLWTNDGAGNFTDQPVTFPTLDLDQDDLVVADIDGDGDLDLVGESRLAVSPYYSYVTILRNNALDFSDTTAYKGSYQFSKSSRLVAVLDADGDTDLDITYSSYVVSNGESIQVLENNGSGSFSDSGGYLPQGIYSLNNEKSTSIDFDNDGDFDILVPTFDYPNASFIPLVNDGTPLSDGNNFSFGSTNVFTGRRGVDELDTLKMNPDAFTDVIMNAYDSVFVLNNNNGNGTFSIDASFFGRAFPGDLDGDGAGDLFAFDSGLKTKRNDGGGTFTDQASILDITLAYDMDTVDIDGDGDLDIAESGASFRIWMNDGNAGFTEGQTIETESFAVEFGDLDGDGDPDMVRTINGDFGQDNPGFQIWENIGGTLSLDQTIGSGPAYGAGFGSKEVFLENIDGDGDLDIILWSTEQVEGEYNYLRNFRNDGGLVFTENTANVLFFDQETQGMDVGDIDGDGDVDVVIALGKTSGTENTIEIITNDGLGTLTPSTGFIAADTLGGSDVNLVDLNGDLAVDILANNETLHQIFFNVGDGSSFTADTVEFASYSYKSFVGDVDDDGDVDIIFGGYVSNPEIWTNDGAGIFEYDSAIPAIADEYTKVIAADLDADGDNDIVFGGYYVGSKFFLNQEVVANQRINESDSSALVKLYEDTDGANWTTNTNWLQNGTKVEDWFGVTVSGGRVVALSLANNGLDGELPADIADLTELTLLELRFNNLTGSTVLNDITSMPNLTQALLSDNLFTGTIPDLSSMTNLQYLIIDQNDFSGPIPATLGSIPSLIGLNLGDNAFTGSIPTELGNLGNLQLLRIWNIPDITGVIPTELGNLSALIELDLGGNSLSGTIPASFGNLQNLQIFYVNDNLLTGDLPTEFTGLTSLTNLSILNNEIENIPDLNPLTNLVDLRVQGNSLSFDDIEPNVGITGFVYAPQNTILPVELSIDQNPTFAAVDTTISVNSTARISLDQGLSGGNIYEWALDGAVIPETSNAVALTQLSRDNTGAYALSVTNSVATDLTLSYDPFDLLASATISVQVNDGDTEAPIPDQVNSYLISLNEEVADTVIFNDVSGLLGTAGEFSYPPVVLGDYLIAVESVEPFLDGEGNEIPGAYIPTYYGDAFLSRNSDTLMLNSDSAISINMVEFPSDIDTGEGIVSGEIFEDFPGEGEGERIDARRRAKKRKCGLRRRSSGGRTADDSGQFELIAYGETNDRGEFEYGFLPQGTYQFFVEYPGIPLDESAFVEFVIGEAGVSDDSFVLAVFASPDGVTIEIILGLTSDYFTDFSIYPNPTADVINIEYSEIKEDKLMMEVLSLEGKVLHSAEVDKSRNKIQYDTSLLKSGQYLLRFSGESGKNTWFIESLKSRI